MVVIRPMREGDRGAAALLIAQAMRTHYGCDPHPLPETAFVAASGGSIVGVIALTFRDRLPLPVETIYVFSNDAAFPPDFDLVRTAQLGRWVASVPHVGEVLLYVAVRHAAAQGCRWGIGEAKPKVRRRFLQLGIVAAELCGTPRLDRIPAGILPYYCSPPLPSPYLIVLGDAVRVLEQRKDRFIARGGNIELSCSC